jgi:ElaB/YqjD/DUF883 family membrane-anchored ribosome-binding protein
MFQHRASEFNSRVSAIAHHLRAIEKELGAIGMNSGRRASAGAATAANQLLDAISPILGDLADRFRRSQRFAADEAASLGNEAVRLGARAGNDALDRIADQAKQRPLFTLAVAIGIGVLIGFVSRRD